MRVIIAQLGVLFSAALLLGAEGATSAPKPVNCEYVKSTSCVVNGCTKTCKTPTILAPALGGGQACPTVTVKVESMPPVNCKLNKFVPGKQLSECDDTGYAFFDYPIEVPASCGGTPCESVRNRVCSKQHCEMSDWMETECNAATNTKTVYRTVLTEPKYGGGLCPPSLNFTAPCGGIDCVLTEWSLWSDEIGDCKDGLAKRSRGISVYPQYGGNECGPTTETRPCAHTPCVYSSWGPTECDRSTGMKSRSRSVLQEATGNGRACNPDRLREEAICDAEDCKYSPWSLFQCDPETGLKTRTRSVVSEAAFGGAPCTQSLVDTQPCDPQNCVIKTSECDPDTLLMTSTIKAPAGVGGKPCPDVLVSSCAPVDCKATDWVKVSVLSKSGEFYHKDTRTVIKKEAFGGKSCSLERTLQYTKCVLKGIKYTNSPPLNMAGADDAGSHWCV